jgi:peptidoglycan-N-acetylglucosamine deacetylase
MPLLSPTTLAIALPLGVTTVAVLTSAHATFIPQSSIWGRNISRGPGAGTANRLALTFDDGPIPGFTDRILEILQHHSIPATFFVIGRHADAHPELLSRIDQAGHLIGNHTYDHDHLGCFGGPGYWRDQLHKTDQAILRAIGKRPALFRPPMGIKSCFTTRAARRQGHALVTWSLRGKDGVATTSARILARLVDQAKGGDILTLHDGADPHCQRTPEVTVETLPHLIQQLRARGLQFARLDDLIGLPGYQHDGKQ